MITVTRYAHGLIKITDHACDYRVEQLREGTRVWRVSRDPRNDTREPIALPRNRYALSQPQDDADFERDLLAAVS